MSDDTPDEIEQADRGHVEAAMAQLSKHFDSVQVFVTRQEGQQTLAFSDGVGNWYARYGQVGEWLENGGAMHLEETDG